VVFEAALANSRIIHVLVLSAAIGGASAQIAPSSAPAEQEAKAEQRARVEAAFTPGDDIAGLLVKRIGEAKKTVQVQAYLFTDRRIANALIAARKRGVAVELVGDAAQHEAGKIQYLKALQRAGVRVYLNAHYASSHNKVVIIDGGGEAATVVTGSYNFTHAAQSRNAENVVVITGDAAVARRFVDNFEKHRGQSTPWP
jgi:phosphatidylserine/phosphatidylglycerophosphate/cardiolipin synthase-like enzyme